MPGHGAPGDTDSSAALGETLLSFVGCVKTRKYSARKGV